MKRWFVGKVFPTADVVVPLLVTTAGPRPITAVFSTVESIERYIEQTVKGHPTEIIELTAGTGTLLNYMEMCGSMWRRLGYDFLMIPVWVDPPVPVAKFETWLEFVSAELVDEASFGREWEDVALIPYRGYTISVVRHRVDRDFVAAIKHGTFRTAAEMRPKYCDRLTMTDVVGTEDQARAAAIKAIDKLVTTASN